MSKWASNTPNSAPRSGTTSKISRYEARARASSPSCPLSQTLRALFSFGGWITLPNLVGPILIYLDRLTIGAQISVSAVAYYAVPYDMVANVGAIPAAMTLVLFPLFATNHAATGATPATPAPLDRPDAAALFHRSVRYTGLVLFPLTLIVVTLAGELLSLWIDPDFARRGARVLQWLAIGRFVNGLAQIPATFLQGIGRPDLPAKFHLAELPLHAVCVFGFTSAFGLVGTAIAWLLRVGLDALLLFAASARFVAPPLRVARPLPMERRVAGNGGWMTLLAVGLLMCGTIPNTPAEKGVFLVAILTPFLWGVCRTLQGAGENTGRPDEASPRRSRLLAAEHRDALAHRPHRNPKESQTPFQI